jgi:ribosomal protein S18 acetylase RimI-like enzyme
MNNLKRLEQSLRQTLTATREHLALQGFDLFISESTNLHLSCAIPKTTEDWTTAIKELLDTFTKRERQSRLEYFHELYPELKAALEQVGFVQEMSAPVMILTDTDLSQAKRINADYIVLEDNEDLLKTFLKRQNLAFGGTGDDSSLSWLDSLKQGLQKESLLGAALMQQGEMVSGAIIQGHTDAELAGVWTLPSKQKQGLAYALCHRLLSDYFSKGQTLCWLSSAEEAQKLYTQLGFRTVGTQLNMAIPAAAPQR